MTAENSEKNNKPSWSQIERFLAGELGEQESILVEDFLSASPDAARVLDLYRSSVTEIAPKPCPANIERSLETLYENYTESGSFTQSYFNSNRSKSFVTVSAALSAVLAILLIPVLWWNSSSDRSLSHDSFHVYYAANGHQAQVTLADGSEVTIGNGSSVRVPVSFGRNDRTISVEGQAYFLVRDQKKSPFIVQTKGAEARVLGTSFMVRRYDSDDATEVLVESGKVSVKPVQSFGTKREDPRIVTPNMKAVIADNGSVELYDAVDVKYALSWRNGALVFLRTPVAKALRDIERKYDVIINVEDSAILSTTLTVSFDQEDVNRVLEVLSMTLNASYSRSGRVITITPRKHNIKRVPAPAPAPFRGSSDVAFVR